MIRLHIDRLVVDGFGLASADGPKLEAALSEELGRLLVADAGAWSAMAAPALLGPAIIAPPAAGAEGLGTAIAGALYGGLRE